MDHTSDPRAAPAPSTASVAVKVWDVPTRLFHWTFATLIVFAYLSAEEDSALRAWHMAAGYAVAILLAFRIVWGFVGGEFARFASFVGLGAVPRHLRELLRGRPEPTQGHNPLGGLAVVLILALAIACVATGALNKGEEGHELIGTFLIAIAGLHVLAVLLMSALTRENLPRAMITGRKHVAAARGLADARPASVGAVVLALIAAGAATAAICAWDPLAFYPRTGAEHSEREADEIEAD